MAIMRRGSKKQVLDHLKKLREASGEEQDRYCEIIERRLKSDATEGVIQNKFHGGWKAVLKVMQNCTYPPEHGDRERYLKINRDQELNHAKLEGINDSSIRTATYFLNEMVEHTQRIRAMATFIEQVGPLEGREGTFFQLWAYISKLQIIFAEAVQMGKVQEAESIQQLITATDMSTDMLFGAKWDPEEVTCVLEELDAKSSAASNTH